LLKIIISNNIQYRLRLSALVAKLKLNNNRTLITTPGCNQTP